MFFKVILISVFFSSFIGVAPTLASQSGDDNGAPCTLKALCARKVFQMDLESEGEYYAALRGEGSRRVGQAFITPNTAIANLIFDAYEEQCTKNPLAPHFSARKEKLLNQLYWLVPASPYQSINLFHLFSDSFSFRHHSRSFIWHLYHVFGGMPEETRASFAQLFTSLKVDIWGGCFGNRAYCEYESVEDFVRMLPSLENSKLAVVSRFSAAALDSIRIADLRRYFVKGGWQSLPDDFFKLSSIQVMAAMQCIQNSPLLGGGQYWNMPQKILVDYIFREILSGQKPLEQVRFVAYYYREQEYPLYYDSETSDRDAEIIVSGYREKLSLVETQYDNLYRDWLWERSNLDQNILLPNQNLADSCPIL